MKMTELMVQLDMLAPTSLAMSWDNVGLLIGRQNRAVHKIYLTLDITGPELEQAVKKGCDTVITHHPMIFSPVKSLRDDDFIGKRILDIAEHGINYYAMHTNFDIAVMGKICAEKLGLTYDRALEITSQEDSSRGIGSVTRLSDSEKGLTLGQLAEKVKQTFNLTGVRVYGDMERSIKTIAICPGSGKGMAGDAIEAGADVLITGDIDHHTGLDSLEMGLCIIDAGHHGLEHIFVEYMKEWLETHITDIDIVTSENLSPFTVI